MREQTLTRALRNAREELCHEQDLCNGGAADTRRIAFRESPFDQGRPTAQYQRHIERAADCTAARLRQGHHIDVRGSPGAKLPEHKHNYPRYGYLLSGELRITNIETGKSATYKPGDFIIESLGQWHKAENAGTEPIKLLVIDQVAKGQNNNTVLRKQHAAMRWNELPAASLWAIFPLSSATPQSPSASAHRSRGRARRCRGPFAPVR